MSNTNPTPTNNNSNNTSLNYVLEKLLKKNVFIKYESTDSVSNTNVTIDDFSVEKLIGMGSFGRVYLVKCKFDQKIYALKILTKDQVTLKSQIMNCINEQKMLLTLIGLSYISRLRWSFQTETKLFIITDYYEQGELFYHLKFNKKFDFTTLKFYLSEVYWGMKHMHDRWIIFRDMKPENIMLNKNGHAIIVDFGLAKMLKPEDKYLTSEFVGTSEYLPPEVIKRNKYSLNFDIWNLGCFAYELMTGSPPFSSNNKDLLYRKIINCEPEYDDTQYATAAIDLIKFILVKNPKERPNLDEILAHPFFEGTDWNQVDKMTYESPLNHYLKTKFDISKIHNYYLQKKQSRKTDYWYEKARDELKSKLRAARREYKEFYYDCGVRGE